MLCNAILPNKNDFKMIKLGGLQIHDHLSDNSLHSFKTSVSKISEKYLSNFFGLKNTIVKKKKNSK